jgi:aspartate-semialdehyde dehydrogenase
MKIALVGATGLVGSTMLNVLEERNFGFTELLMVASEKSVGKEIEYKGKKHTVIGLQTAVDAKPAIAIFSAGGSVSTEWAPKFAANGTYVIDNSSAWRMHNDVALVVPEINGKSINPSQKIIANPNCSTIQMVMALAPLHKEFCVKRVVVSTYQSVTGTGVKAVNQLMNERAGLSTEMAYKYPIDLNVIPQIDVFMENGYTKEEMKMIKETNKIMGDDSIKVTATAIRIPVMGGHSESVNIQFAKPVTVAGVQQILSKTEGIKVQDDPSNQVYPMPKYAEGHDEVFVGRIRMDESQENTVNMWIVSDNLRKGAATNAVQIAEYLVKHRLV